MAAENTIVIEGLKEQQEKFKQLMTDSPGMEKRLRDVIRKALAHARANLQKDAAAGLQMKSDPRHAYKAVRYAVYKKIFGGQVNILDGKGNAIGSYYEPPRHPSHRGGNRMTQSGRTKSMMSYQGAQRGFILRFLNAGTDTRYAGYGRNGRTQGDRDKFIQKIGGRGHRGRIAPRNWFKGASMTQLNDVADYMQTLIDKIINEEFK